MGSFLAFDWVIGAGKDKLMKRITGNVIEMYPTAEALVA